ncbi:Belongs to the cytochrome P450 [Recurvomyces mirabilis]|nr:Belongs to the cytochrome P450 [Recurvomyces mirabilis]
MARVSLPKDFSSEIARSYMFSLVDPQWPWTQNHRIFAKVGADVFIACAPNGNVVYIADPTAVTSVLNRSTEFLKPPGLAFLMDVYGKNILSANGHDWRRYRKILAPQFSDANNEIVWRETLHATAAMLGGVKSPDGSKIFPSLAPCLMHLSLRVISAAGFGVRLEASCSDQISGGEQLVSVIFSPEHKIGYLEALEGTLGGIYWIALLPTSALRWLPWQSIKFSLQCSKEWGRYMYECYIATKNDLNGNVVGDGKRMDLMGSLARSEAVDGGLEPSEILGNAFVLLLAGHESTANSLHLALLYLSLYPDVQRQLQNELDVILRDRPTEFWTFSQDLPDLASGLCGAILHEVLRLQPPVLYLVKFTSALVELETSLGRAMIPAKSRVILCTAASHRNPNSWLDTNTDEGLDDFRPERWLIGDSKHGGSFLPVRGSYYPFSQGTRACLGRRFAQTEMLAGLAMIVKFYSIELFEQRPGLEAAMQARLKMADVRQYVTAKMRDERIAVKLTPRNVERRDKWVKNLV